MYYLAGYLNHPVSLYLSSSRLNPIHHPTSYNTTMLLSVALLLFCSVLGSASPLLASSSDSLGTPYETYLDPEANVVRTKISVEEVMKLLEVQAQSPTNELKDNNKVTTFGLADLGVAIRELNATEMMESNMDDIECQNDPRGALVPDILVRSELDPSNSGRLEHFLGVDFCDEIRGVIVFERH